MRGETDLTALSRGMSATLILFQSDAIAHALPYEFPCRMITLNVHSALEAVGFMAHIAAALAAKGMGVNPVAGFYHDHLFVPEGREAEAMAVLQDMATAPYSAQP